MDGWKTREREREREKSEERGKISLFDKINSIRHPATDIIFLFSHIEKERERLFSVFFLCVYIIIIIYFFFFKFKIEKNHF